MKSKIIIAAMLLGTSLPAFSWMREGALINLKVSKAAQDVRLDYPGSISGVCGLKLASSQDLWLDEAQLEALSKNILVSDNFWEEGTPLTPEVVTGVPFIGSEIHWTLTSNHTYVTVIHIKSANGKSLNSVVSSIVGETEASVVLVATGCDK